jgi:hypothetical protein
LSARTPKKILARISLESFFLDFFQEFKDKIEDILPAIPLPLPWREGIIVISDGHLPEKIKRRRHMLHA